MRIFKFEAYKIYGNLSFVFLLFLFLIINSILLYTKTPNDIVDRQTYRQIYQYLETLEEEARIPYIQERYLKLDALVNLSGLANQDLPLTGDDSAYLQFSDDEFEEWWVFNELNSEVEDILAYDAFLAEIQTKANAETEVSIFQNASVFSARNAEKTAEAYTVLDGTTPQLTNSHSFDEATDFAVTDIFVIFLFFYLIVRLVVLEKERGLFSLLRPLSRGQGMLMLSKIGVILISSFLFAALFWGGNFLIATLKYGPVDLDIALQSVGGYIGSAMNITIRQYFLIFFISKSLVYFCIAMVILLLSVVFKRNASLFCSTALFFGISYLLYSTIDGSSPLQFFKYVNVINFVQINSIFHYYFNLNFFSYPVNIVTVFAWTVIPAIVLLPVLNVIIFCRRSGMTTVKSTLHKGRRKPRVHTTLLYHEFYKLFSVQKAGAILLVLCVTQGYQYYQTSSFIGTDETHYKQYMDYLEGTVTEEKLAYIQAEEERYLYYGDMLSEAQEEYGKNQMPASEFAAIQTLVTEQTKGWNAFEYVKERLTYIENYATQTGTELPFVYETGYEYLTGNDETNNESDMYQAGLLLITSIAIFSGFFAMEFSSGMIHIISCYKRGGTDTSNAKLLVCLPTAIIIFVVSYTPQILLALKLYGFSSFGAPIASIPSLSGFPLNISIWQYMALIYAERLLAYICTLLMIAAISAVAKNMIKAIAALSVLFLLPLFIHVLGISLVDYISLNTYLSGNLFFGQITRPSTSLLILIPAALGVFSLYELKKSFTLK